MMHMPAHCAHSVHGAMPVHMHIPPIGDVQYVQHPEQAGRCFSKSDLSSHKACVGPIACQRVELAAHPLFRCSHA